MAQRTAEVDRVDFLAGEIHALKSFALVVAATHPNREILMEHFEGSSQASSNGPAVTAIKTA